MLIVVLLLKMHFIDDKYLAGVRTCRNVPGLTQSLWRDIAEKKNGYPVTSYTELDDIDLTK